MRGRVTFVRDLGASVEIYLACDGTEVVAVSAPRRPPRPPRRRRGRHRHRSERLRRARAMTTRHRFLELSAAGVSHADAHRLLHRALRDDDRGQLLSPHSGGVLRAGLRVRQLCPVPLRLLRRASGFLALSGGACRGHLRGRGAAVHLSAEPAAAAPAGRVARGPAGGPLAVGGDHRLRLVDALLAHRRHHEPLCRGRADERPGVAVAELRRGADRHGLSGASRTRSWCSIHPW